MCVNPIILCPLFRNLPCSVNKYLEHIYMKVFFFLLIITYNTVLWNAAAAKSLQSCPTLCDPTDSSPPGSPVPGTLQARTLELAAISFTNA